MNKFIKVTDLDTETEKQLFINIDFIIEFGPVQNCTHKLFMKTTSRKMLWIKEDLKTVTDLILKAQGLKHETKL